MQNRVYEIFRVTTKFVSVKRTIFFNCSVFSSQRSNKMQGIVATACSQGDKSKVAPAASAVADQTRSKDAVSSSGQHRLYLLNSLTRKKELFVPHNGMRVDWYSCGPTVYDVAHLGHGRTYVCFDVIRRVLTQYFNYDVRYVMNITDIDDKIIKRARQRYLFDEFVQSAAYKEQATFEALLGRLEVHLQKKLASEKDEEKKQTLETDLRRVRAAKSDTKADRLALTNSLKDVIGDQLDRDQPPTRVYDNAIFNDVPRYFEDTFFTDMCNLNVAPPDVLTRVSEFVPEIIAYTRKIVDNGFAYVTPSGCVYFDTQRFAKTTGFRYAKLVPEAFGNEALLAEGEGELSDPIGDEKRSAADFALWKASKSGEPSWESEFGKGRPGWHIECSVMAQSVCGSKLDIHSGGVDLKFPHHDNEMAQSEAFVNEPHANWVNYFVHSGHLHIDGRKMAKSLKNFITIREAMQQYSARQLRLLFVMQNWTDMLNYSAESMQLAISFERYVTEFIAVVRDALANAAPKLGNVFPKTSAEDLAMLDRLRVARERVDQALCDNVDTVSVIRELRSLINEANSYMKPSGAAPRRNPNVLRQLGAYVVGTLRLLGVFGESDWQVALGTQSSEGSGSREEMLAPPVRQFARFRDEVRRSAREQKNVALLQLCDAIRDEVFPLFGCRLDDIEGQNSLVKFLDDNEFTKLKESLQVPANEIFKRDEKWRGARFDADGVPTHDDKNKPLPKNVAKQLRKQFETHERLRARFAGEYVASLRSTGDSNDNVGKAADAAKKTTGDHERAGDAGGAPSSCDAQTESSVRAVLAGGQGPLGAAYTSWLQAAARNMPKFDQDGENDASANEESEKQN